MTERLFKLKENGTNVRTEVLAGITTFMTMAYILIVNPDILSKTGMEAIRCGTKVIVDTGEIITEFPLASPKLYYAMYNFMVN